MSKWVPSRKKIVAGVAVIFSLAISVYTIISYSPRDTSRLKTCQSNLKKMGLALRQYADDHDEKYPLARSWWGDLFPYHKDYALETCPSGSRYSYAMNRYTVGVNLRAMPSPQNEPVFFDVVGKRPNPIADGSAWMSPGRHKEGSNVSFADGHVEWLLDKPPFNPIPIPTPYPTLKRRRDEK